MSESWKTSPTVFQKQLDLNLGYLRTGSYPPHWNTFLAILKKIRANHQIRNVLDIGCGCGAYYGLLRKEHPDLIYLGVDFAEHAINLAKKHWGVNQFFVKSLWDFKEIDLEPFDLIYCDGLFEVMEDADQALKFFMALRPRMAIINRINSQESPSSSKTYRAYDEIRVFRFTHNREELRKTLEPGYEVEPYSSAYLVRRVQCQNQP